MANEKGLDGKTLAWVIGGTALLGLLSAVAFSGGRKQQSLSSHSNMTNTPIVRNPQIPTIRRTSGCGGCGRGF